MTAIEFYEILAKSSKVKPSKAEPSIAEQQQSKAEMDTQVSAFGQSLLQLRYFIILVSTFQPAIA